MKIKRYRRASVAKKPRKVAKPKSHRVQKSDFGDIKVVKTNSVKFKQTKLGTRYQPLFDKIAAMKAGESIEVPVPEGVTSRQVQNRITMAMRRENVLPPKGSKLRKRVLVNGNIAIQCVGLKGDK